MIIYLLAIFNLFSMIEDTTESKKFNTEAVNKKRSKSLTNNNLSKSQKDNISLDDIIKKRPIKPGYDGKYGNVFFGILKKDGRPVVITSPDEKYCKLDKIMNEINVMDYVGKSPFIIDCIGVNRDPKTAMIVTEYLPKGSFNDCILINNEGNNVSFTFKERRNIASDFCKGMSLLRKRGIFLRDAGINNLMITNDNRGKIADFKRAAFVNKMTSKERAEVKGMDNYNLISTLGNIFDFFPLVPRFSDDLREPDFVKGVLFRARNQPRTPLMSRVLNLFKKNKDGSDLAEILAENIEKAKDDKEVEQILIAAVAKAKI